MTLPQEKRASSRGQLLDGPKVLYFLVLRVKSPWVSFDTYLFLRLRAGSMFRCSCRLCRLRTWGAGVAGALLLTHRGAIWGRQDIPLGLECRRTCWVRKSWLPCLGYDSAGETWVRETRVFLVFAACKSSLYNRCAGLQRIQWCASPNAFSVAHTAGKIPPSVHLPVR